VAAGRDLVKVKILQVSACAGCHAKGACTMADMEEKIIDVEDFGGRQYKAGDHVTLQMGKGSGNRAIVMGYLVPFLLMVAALITGSYFIHEEGILALVSISVLIPYFVILYLRRDKMKGKFVIRIKS